MRKVVCITGTGHCGSTLLDLLLGSHSEAFSLGEFHTIQKLIRKDNQDGICIICGSKCEFWSERTSQRLLRLFYQTDSFARKVCSRLIRLLYNPYRLMFRWSGASVLVDSSKGMNWFKAQFRPRYAVAGFEQVLIWVYRDGRAVVNSYHRKYPELGIEHHTNHWLQSVAKLEESFATFDGPKLKIAYEDLTLNPEAATQRVCEFLDLKYEPEMLRYWEHDHHHLFGNAGTNNAIIRHRQKLADCQRVDPNWAIRHEDYFDTSYYESQGLKIKHDERWKRELAREHLQVFETLAGTQNAKFGYASATK